MKKQRVLVFGTGMSGISAAKFMQALGASVILYDENPKLKIEKIRGKLSDNEENIEICNQKLSEEELGELDLVILSPGVPLDLPMVAKMKELGIEVIGEIEMAYRYAKGDVLAITGTNGKTTTTALLGAIMKAYRSETYVVGNIGKPFADVVLHASEKAIYVLEASSFQLETIHTFAPKVSAVLNVTPDHLNRHHTMEAYIEAKERIAMNQTDTGYCVLNYEDDVVRKMAEKTKATVMYFSSQRALDRGMYLEQGNIVYHYGEKQILCHIDELQVLGTHNHENVMAAATMALAYGVPIDVVREVVCSFSGVEHRIEFVREVNGVTYYNDSKGTNPDAAIKAIQAMNRPTILIGGGYDKASSYEEWIMAFDGKVKQFVLTGQTRFKIQDAAKQCGFEDTILVEDFEDAVNTCVRLAQEGDSVLLSPACASWGTFRNYEERGDKFKELINNL